ncbi:MAG TPA: hypothetical protein VK843_04340, partial [Planctomycetota bacterium]|nr:hypothetical protein [Planctomycetota bacterium]
MPLQVRSSALWSWTLPFVLAIASCALFVLFDKSGQEARWLGEEQVLRSQVLLFEELVAPQLEHPEPAAIQAQVQRVGKATGVRFTLIREDGTVLADSEADPVTMDNHGTRAEVLAASTAEFGTSRRVSRTLGAEFLYVARAIRRDGVLLGWIRASVRSAEIRGSLSMQQWLLGILAAVAGSLAVVLGVRRLQMSI